MDCFITVLKTVEWQCTDQINENVLIRPISNHTPDKNSSFTFYLECGVGSPIQLTFFKDVSKTYGAFSFLDSIPIRAKVANGSPRQACFVWVVQHLQIGTFHIKIQISDSCENWMIAKSVFHSLNNELASEYSILVFSGPVLYSLPQLPPSLPNVSASAPSTYISFQAAPYRHLNL